MFKERSRNEGGNKTMPLSLKQESGGGSDTWGGKNKEKEDALLTEIGSVVPKFSKK